MILVSIIFFGGIGYLEGAQEVPDLPLASILNKRRVISLPYKQRALSGSIGEKLKEKMGHKLMIGSHYSYKCGKLPWPLWGHIVPLGGVMGYG